MIKTITYERVGSDHHVVNVKLSTKPLRRFTNFNKRRFRFSSPKLNINNVQKNELIDMKLLAK